MPPIYDTKWFATCTDVNGLNSLQVELLRGLFDSVWIKRSLAVLEHGSSGNPHIHALFELQAPERSDVVKRKIIKTYMGDSKPTKHALVLKRAKTIDDLVGYMMKESKSDDWKIVHNSGFPPEYLDECHRTYSLKQNDFRMIPVSIVQLPVLIVKKAKEYDLDPVFDFTKIIGKMIREKYAVHVYFNRLTHIYDCVRAFTDESTDYIDRYLTVVNDRW